MAKRTTTFQWAAEASPDTENQLRPSRSEKKRQALALQELGEALTHLTPAELAKLNLPPALFTAIADLTSITSREARRRHNQYIGRLMRELNDEEQEAIRFAMANRLSPPR